jgi:hypothetical protein
MSAGAEALRMAEELLHRESNGLWRLWGPYLSERQWGTVREDYSADGNAWAYFPFSHSHLRAYRWGEDGLAGYCDHHQRLCIGLALWNGKDPILKERLFGLTNEQGNHGEDCKEQYYYLDATPSHSYLRMLYKYPQAEFPYEDLIETNRRRGKHEPEYELLDTGVFDGNRYFDVFVEYAKGSPHEVNMKITIHNRGSETATLHILPQLWFRNTWSWKPGSAKPGLTLTRSHGVEARHEGLGTFYFQVEEADAWLFTENETNAPKLFGVEQSGPFKDAFHEVIVHGNSTAVNPLRVGTKCAAHLVRTVPAGGSVSVRARLSPEKTPLMSESFEATLSARRSEADEYFADLQKDISGEDARGVHRQALAGMIWSKQYYYFDVPEWLKGDPGQPPPPQGRKRNRDWDHVNNADVISMPDKWEYPWYAAWDLAFHTVPLALVDPEFAKSQLLLITREWYMHPNGQLPAYEWAFGDVNPPVHAWATWKVFQMDKSRRGGKGDLPFLERVFHKLMLNFTWWVNRKDVDGRNVFQGGFLGLDNIGVFDRSAPLPHGGFISQADGTAWMAMYSLNLMRIALELARHNPVYQDIATKFFEHFLHIAQAMNNIGESGIGLWDEDDEFYYDVMHFPDGRNVPLKVRSLVGLLPLTAVEVLDAELLAEVPEFTRRLRWFLNYRPDLAKLVSRWNECGQGERHLLSLLRGHRMKCLLRRMLDETEFLSPHGVRGLSKHHEERPYVFECSGNRLSVGYEPAESRSHMFGGNSNWRGPVWFPVNYLFIESLKKFHSYYGDDFKIECPQGSGHRVTLHDASEDLTRRLASLFLKNENGQRPVFNHSPTLNSDPHFRDHVLFYEYFHGDTGRGVGASHQTGWTGLIANLLQTSEPE